MFINHYSIIIARQQSQYLINGAIMANEDKNLSERLRFALKVLGISQTELAKRIDVKPQVIQYLCSGNSKKTKFMFDIAEALKIDVAWLATGNGKSPSNSAYISNEKAIPILTFNQIKEWKINQNEIDFNKTTKIPIQDDINANSFAISLNDQSMAPRFSIDTIIIIDPTVDIYQTQQNSRFVLAYLYDEDFFVFRQLDIANDVKTLIPINTNLYKNTFLTDNDHILGICKEARWIA